MYLEGKCVHLTVSSLFGPSGARPPSVLLSVIKDTSNLRSYIDRSAANWNQRDTFKRPLLLTILSGSQTFPSYKASDASEPQSSRAARLIRKNRAQDWEGKISVNIESSLLPLLTTQGFAAARGVWLR